MVTMIANKDEIKDDAKYGSVKITVVINTRGILLILILSILAMADD